MNRKKISIMMITWITCMISLCGCAEQKIDTDMTTVFVHKDGRITDAIVEDFGQSYYNVTELQTMTNKELTAYNQTTGSVESAVLSSYEVTDGVAKVFIDFATAADYGAFNGKDCFFGTVAEAYEAGYALDVTLKSVSGDETLDKSALLEKGKYKILIIEEHVDIEMYKKILYTSANVELIEDNHARVSDEAEGFAYLIVK